jgi:hypothetical protein
MAKKQSKKSLSFSISYKGIARLFARENLLKTLIVLVVLAGAGAFLIGFNYTKLGEQQRIATFKTKIIPDFARKVINDPSIKLSIDKVKETSGVYEFEITIERGGRPQKFVSYITKDGRILFPTGVKIDSVPQIPIPTPQPPK